MTSTLVRVEHLWQKRHTPEAKQLFRYSAVSVISTVVSFVVLFFVFGVFHIWEEVGSTVFANGVATVPSYYLNRSWVWGKNGRSQVMREVVPFWVMAVLGIAVSMGGAAIAHHVGVANQLSHMEQTALVLFANVMSFAVFWVLKFMIYNRIFKVHPVEELDDLVEAA